MPRVSLPLLVLLPVAAFGLGPACARSGRPSPPELAGLDLGLPAPPAMVAHLEISGDLREYAGPARMERKSIEPLHLLLEDFALAEPLEILVDPQAPGRFGQPMGQRFTDRGSFLDEGDRVLLSLAREWDDGAQEQIIVVGRLSPQPQRPPRDWLAPGTRLFYGLSFDDKPITGLVPLGLMLTVEAAPPGERLLSWQAEVDPDAQVDDSRLRLRSGRVHLSAEVAERGTAHSDLLVEGEQELDHTAFFVPRQAARNLASLGAAAWLDRDAPGTGVLESLGTLTVTLQADDALWSVPGRVARVSDTGAVYVIADDPESPLLISAVRPGWRMRLMAIGRPR